MYLNISLLRCWKKFGTQGRLSYSETVKQVQICMDNSCNELRKTDYTAFCYAICDMFVEIYVIYNKQQQAMLSTTHKTYIPIT